MHKTLRSPALITLAIMVVVVFVMPFLLPWSHDQIDWTYDESVSAWAQGHYLGVDVLGRDYLARLLVATRTTLLVAGVAAFISLLIGVFWGCIAGWYGGKTDNIMMRIVDILYALPFMFIVIVLMVVFGRSVLMLFIGIALVEWLTMARITRGQVIALKKLPFIEAAQLLAVPDGRIIISHILPNIIKISLAWMTLTLPNLIMIESFLSFLGLGVQEPMTSLGILIKDGADMMDIAPMALILPSLIMMVMITCLTLLGDNIDREKSTGKGGEQ